MSIFNRSAAGLPTALVFSLAVGCSDPSSPGTPEVQRQLLMLSNSEGSAPDIYRVNADGTDRVRLTFDGAQYGTMSLSPDGQRFVYMSSCTIIWTMNVDGTGARPLTTYQQRCNRYPRWSPDGKYISFSTTREGPYSIYVMNPDGTDQRNVSRAADPVAPTKYSWGWSPEGRVVFMHRGNGTALSTYTVKPDGTDYRRLFEREGDHSPRWSPDGSKIAFIREMESQSVLHVMNADGSNVRRLTNHDGRDELSAEYLPENDHSYWSADGQYLVFYRLVPNFVYSLHVIRADGTGLRNLAEGGDLTDRFNGWSPDGRITLHRRGQQPSMDIFLVKPDGSGLSNMISNSAMHEFNALWLPRQ